jgi:flagellar motor protein MotB
VKPRPLAPARRAVPRTALYGALGLFSAACGGAPLHIAALDNVERLRQTPGVRAGAALAPQAFAHAEEERAFAERAHAQGDDVAAELHAELATAAYEHAIVVARLARATVELADAQKQLGDATAQCQAVEASRTKLDADAKELEQRAQVARERLLPALSASATAERDTARLVEARSMAVEARLLCGAARLVAPSVAGLSEAEDAVNKVEVRLEKSARASLIDDATRARATCLDALTRGRRSLGGEEGRSDVLLEELSANGGWDPSRDERGVVIALRGLFRGADLTQAAEARLKDLGRVAAAHPDFAVQVVVHDARQPAAGDAQDTRRAAAVTSALVAGGADAKRVQSALAGARIKVVDPADAGAAARNERVEVVFVTGAK